LSFYARGLASIAAAAILSYFAYQIAFASKMPPPLRIGLIAAIAAIGVAGILALLAPDGDDAPPEKLYTADEVAQLLTAAQAGRLGPAASAQCRFCGAADPDATGVDGSRYHRRCFREAFDRGKT
jgi:hypothetical protein